MTGMVLRLSDRPSGSVPITRASILVVESPRRRKNAATFCRQHIIRADRQQQITDQKPHIVFGVTHDMRHTLAKSTGISVAVLAAKRHLSGRFQASRTGVTAGRQAMRFAPAR